MNIIKSIQSFFKPEETTQTIEWVSLKGYEGQYFVSNDGRVKSVKKYKDGRVRETMLNPSDAKNRMLVRISFKGKAKTLKLHRLVAHAFVPNPDNLDEVSFRDNNYKNCKASNLMWRPRYDKKNVASSYVAHQEGEKNHGHKLKNKEAAEIKKKAKDQDWSTFKMIADQYNVSATTVYDINKGRRRKHLERDE